MDSSLQVLIYNLGPFQTSCYNRVELNNILIELNSTVLCRARCLKPGRATAVSNLIHKL